MIGLVTDSTAELPAELVERFGIEVVPATVCIGEGEYLEGVDLDADVFYARLAAEPRVPLASSEPSPGQFALAYDALVERGCTQILSIHGSTIMSGTVNAARLGSRCVPVPVRVVDMGTSGFALGGCVWAAAEAIAAGACLDRATESAEAAAAQLLSVFVVGPGSRLSIDHEPCTVPVLGLDGGQVHLVECAPTMVDAINAMTSRIVRTGDRLRVGVGTADRSVAPSTDALRAAIGEAGNVVEVVDYRVCPSVGAYTGPGTVACVAIPIG